MNGLTAKAVSASLVAVSIAAVWVGLQRSDDARAPGSTAKVIPTAAPRCGFEAGETAAFSLESRVRDVRGEEEDHLRGTLSWSVVEQVEVDRWRLRAALHDVSLTQALSSPGERVEGPISDPFFIEVDASCRFVGFGFPRSWDARRRQLVQSTLLAHEYVAPTSTRAARWQTSQSDGMGAFGASYALLPAEGGEVSRVQRHKGAYEAEARAAAFGLAVAVVGSEATASFDRRSGHWLVASSGLERVQIRFEGELAADLLQRFRLTREDSLYAPVPAMEPSEADFGSAFDLEIERAPVVEGKIAERSFEGALEAFHERFQGGGDPSYAAARELAGWLRAHPEGAELLAAALRGGEIDDAARAALFLALELSGAEEARATLSELLVDPRLPPVDRARAASALSDLGEPTRASAALLLAQGQGEGEAMVASVSMLGFGHMAKRGDEELRGYVREALGRELAACVDDVSRTRLVIDAMGNSGDPSLAETISAHLDAPSPATRKHAVEALGRLDPASSGPHLLARLASESDPAVRASIVGAYQGRPTAEAIALMSETLELSSSAAERAALISWLGAASRTEPEAYRRLVAHMHRESDARLIQKIGAYVPAEALR